MLRVCHFYVPTSTPENMYFLWQTTKCAAGDETYYNIIYIIWTVVISKVYILYGSIKVLFYVENSSILEYKIKYEFSYLFL